MLKGPFRRLAQAVDTVEEPFHRLDARFENLGLGLVDGMVATVAERRQVYRVLTTDRRDFSAIRVGPRLARALELVP
jgi:predicted nucleic acid-binding protein